jgi:hypothetical protein
VSHPLLWAKTLGRAASVTPGAASIGGTFERGPSTQRWRGWIAVEFPSDVAALVRIRSSGGTLGAPSDGDCIHFRMFQYDSKEPAASRPFFFSRCCTAGNETFTCDAHQPPRYDRRTIANRYGHARVQPVLIVTFSSDQLEWQKAPRHRVRAPGRRRWTGRVVACLLGGASGLIAACTLVGEDYHPRIVSDSEPLAPSPVGTGDDAGGCAVDVECCDAVGCPDGQVCLEAQCVNAEVPPLPEEPDAGCIGPDCPGATPVPLAPTCDDDAQNGDETGVDCGGSCTSGCAVGATCQEDDDCDEGLSCLPETSICALPSCGDGQLNGDELAEDCGGTCSGCPDGSPCNVGTDCESRVCDADDGTCSAPSCDDDQQNGDETGVDCGGTCPQNCPNGAGCEGEEDCLSGVCGGQGCADGVELCCQVPSCDDEVRNGAESDVDCGAPGCGDCALGENCQFANQCQTNQCTGGECTDLPTCTDDEENGNETDVDCGGGTCGRCPNLSECNVGADCISNNCFAGTCISCGDTVQNGTETDADCGGADPACRRCGTGESCQSNTDCLSMLCVGGFC